MRFAAVFFIVVMMGASLLSSSPVTAQSTTDNQRIEAIEITGNKRVAAGTVLSYLPLRVGDLVTAGSMNTAVARLFDTDLFEDISLEMVDGVLRVTIAENPIINRVNIEGNDVITDEKLLEFLDIQPRRVYTRKMAIEGAQRLLRVYQAGGRYAAVVEPQIIKLDENRIDLVFKVDEGPLIKISSITFSGNQLFSDSKLKTVIASREKRWWAILSATDKYDEGRLEYDARLLRQFYLARGYADINVTRVRGGLLPDRTGFAVTFLLEEGLRYKVGDIEITSEIENIDLELMKAQFDFGDDSWYDVRALEQGLLDITNELGNYGYAFVDVLPEIVTDAETGLAKILVKIGEARKNYVERIEIINNTRTTDTVIRRELELVEGDAFNSLKLERSLRNVRNLGYFADVSVRNIVGSSPEQTVTEIDVEEQSTGELSLGLGYSSLDKASFNVGIVERNFLGTGRGLDASIGTSGSRTDIRLGISEPYLLGRNLRGSATVFNQQINQNSTDIEKTGFDFGIGFTAANNIYHRVGYTLSQAQTKKKSTTAQSVTGEDGKTLLQSAVSYTVGRDTRDSRFDPSTGTLLELFEEVSGIGGDVTYSKTIVKGAFYRPYLFNTLVFGVQGELGHVNGFGENVTQSQRFFLGGYKVRGFDGNGIGPRDIGNNAAVGGNNVASGTLELVSTLGLSKDLGLRWTVFSDIGSVWGNDYPTGVKGAENSALRTSLGFGILWDTAIGPLSFYWADAISKESYDGLKRFQFTIGTRL
jgi:outer membrane protein insertion porin family